MALTRITSLGLADGAIQATDIADGVVTTAKIADSNVTSAKLDANGSYSIAELTITGTSALQLPTGTEAQRPGSPTNGLIRFNTTAGKLEVYNTAKAKWDAAGAGGGASAGMAYFASSF